MGHFIGHLNKKMIVSKQKLALKRSSGSGDGYYSKPQGYILIGHLTDIEYFNQSQSYYSRDH